MTSETLRKYYSIGLRAFMIYLKFESYARSDMGLSAL